MGFQRFENPTEPKGMHVFWNWPRASSRAQCLCCSVAPAHSIIPLNKGKEEFYADLHVWHVRQVPALGACSPRQKTKAQAGWLWQRKIQPDNKLCLDWSQRQGFGLRRMRKQETWQTVFHRSINKDLPRLGFLVLLGAQSSHYLSTVHRILHVFSHLILAQTVSYRWGESGVEVF